MKKPSYAYRRGVKSPYFLAAVVVSALGDIDVTHVVRHVESNDNFTYGEVIDAQGGRYWVKYPLNNHAALTLEAEIGVAHSLLEQLREGKLPFDVVRPRGFAPLSKGGRALVARVPVGIPREFSHYSRNQARQLGRALASIHSLPPQVATDAGLASLSTEDCRRRMLSMLHEVDQASPLPSLLRRRWEAALENRALWDFHPRFIHGDLDSSTVLWEGNTLATVLGFGEAHVGDPARDFARLRDVPPQACDELFDAYENTLGVNIEPSTLERADLLYELSIAEWLLHGVSLKDDAIIAEAHEMLLDLADDLTRSGQASPARWNVSPEGALAPEADVIGNGETLISSADHAHASSATASASTAPTAATAWEADQQAGESTHGEEN